MMTKKLAALFAAGLLTVSVLSACGDDDDTDTDTGDDTQTSTSQMMEETTTTAGG